jgi:hypothetical protein
MKKNTAINLTPLLTIVFLFGLKREIYAQEIQVLKTNSNFFTRIQFGGGLGLSAGYRNENVTMGVRYNVLHKDRENVYTEAFMPFVRVLF